MSRRLLLGGALVVALIAFSLMGAEAPPERAPYIQGRNKTVLVLANMEHGLTNVHSATAFALLEKYPDIDVHYGSFGPVEKRAARLSAFARARTPEARDIIFHKLKGFSYTEALRVENRTMENTVHAAGLAGLNTIAKDMQQYISPWSAESHLELYHELRALINEIDPAVIVLDPLFRPGIDATRDLNRQHVIVSPNTLIDNFVGEQPYGAMFWKYPTMASGLSFPIPLKDVPLNIYLSLIMIRSVVMTPALSAKKAILREKGLKDPINFFGLHRPDVPWISMTQEGASIPLDVVPPNVTCAGPILVDSAPAEEQDPELVAWMKKAPTILVNLGSHVIVAMTGGLARVLSATNVQVIWKFNKDGEYSDDVLAPLQPYVDSGRVKMSNWLPADPYALLQTGDIVASLHHGGASCYHEAVAAGVPHVIFPLWADLYNYAALVGDLGIGVWACPETSPNWSSECVGDAILKVVDSEASAAIKAKASQLGAKVQAQPKGREVAAREIAKLAYVK
ncbi:hypothetical protein B0I35DRAFT_360877 [Stachybotrys elegans]|uniref:Erythromycin biosynthesis protein CIII-like C-terminal domain-containing protein n=1 Tax=Stachybotrys elegans TaxID=80388 RepID=A0A8K0WMV6_9HYPO|nr:hypothetical protein B0I35DRAFT_360877 [Stachybotrys elegans]